MLQNSPSDLGLNLAKDLDVCMLGSADCSPELQSRALSEIWGLGGILAGEPLLSIT